MILVIQFRDDVSEDHEQKCVLKHLENKSSVKFISAFDETIDWSNVEKIMKNIEKVVLGGSGGLLLSLPDKDDKNTRQKHQVLKNLDKIMNHIFENDIPCLGVCLGHQLIAQMLGGKVEKNSEMAETGFATIYLNEEGKKDPIFANVPESFDSIVGHKDSVTVTPEGALILAYSDKCPNHAFRYKKNIYATQFHSELVTEDLVFRLNLYPEYKEYATNIEPKDTTIAVRILENFLKM